jgi:hypothetical protein
MEKKELKKSVFETLNAIDVNEHTEKKNGLTYLSWPWAWATVKGLYPDTAYEVRHWDGKPFYYDEVLGYMVETTVTIEGESKTMWLPVMDSKNKAQKSHPYTYTVTFRGKTEEKSVEAATMFDINTAIMRCLVKNLAMFGLGLYIYAGEDLPAVVVEQAKEAAAAELPQAIEEMKAVKTRDEYLACWDKWARKRPEFSVNGHDFYKIAVEIGSKFPQQ